MCENVADCDSYYNYHDLAEWYNGYKQRKAKRAQIKKELMPIPWYPTKIQGWCMAKDEKKRIKEMLP